MLQHLLEELHHLLDLSIVETVERHNRKLCNHVAKRRKSLLLIHVEQKNRRHIRHTLDISINYCLRSTYPISGLYMVKASRILWSCSDLSFPGKKILRAGNVLGMSVSIMLMLFSLPVEDGYLINESVPIMNSSFFFSLENFLLSSMSLIVCELSLRSIFTSARLDVMS